MFSRRNFIKLSGGTAGSLLCSRLPAQFHHDPGKTATKLHAHLWVYASRFPPDWDCTPILDEAFSDIKAASFSGIELMEAILKHEGSVQRLQDLVGKYNLPVAGTSYYGDMWDEAQQTRIYEDVELVLQRLHQVGGKMIGLTVGDAKRVKTEEELDAQAETLKRILVLCKENHIAPNLHNHTFEITNSLHDLKATLKRVPDVKLGPDLNWLLRGGVDPVSFIKTYGHRMVYMHIRDQDAGGKWTEAVGEGVTNFHAIAKALKEIKYAGDAAVELAFDTPPKNAVREDWRKSRQYVKNTFGW